MKLPSYDRMYPNEPSAPQYRDSSGMMQLIGAQGESRLRQLQAGDQVVQSGFHLLSEAANAFIQVKKAHDAAKVRDAQIGAMDDMRAFQLTLEANPDYSQYPDLLEKFRTQTEQKYQAQLGPLTDQWRGWWTQTYGSWQIDTAGKAFAKMAADTQTATRNQLDAAVARGDHDLVDTVVAGAKDTHVFAPAVLDAMATGAHERVNTNAFISAASSMSADQAALFLGSDAVKEKVPDPAKREAILRDTLANISVREKAKQQADQKRWDDNYTSLSTSISNDEPMTASAIEDAYKSDRIDVRYFNDLNSQLSARDRLAKADALRAQGAKAQAASTEDKARQEQFRAAYGYLYDAFRAGRVAPLNIPGFERFGGRPFSREDVATWTRQHMGDVGVDWANSQLKSLAGDWPDEVQQAHSKLGSAATAAIIKQAYPKLDDAGVMAKQLDLQQELFNWASTSKDLSNDAVGKYVTGLLQGVTVPRPRVEKTVEGDPVIGYTRSDIRKSLLEPGWAGKLFGWQTSHEDLQPVADAAVRTYRPDATSFMGTDPDEGRVTADGRLLYVWGNPAKPDARFLAVMPDGKLAGPTGKKGEWVPFADQRPAAEIRADIAGQQEKALRYEKQAAEDQQGVAAGTVNPMSASLSRDLARTAAETAKKRIDDDIRALVERGASAPVGPRRVISPAPAAAPPMWKRSPSGRLEQTLGIPGF